MIDQANLHEIGIIVSALASLGAVIFSMINRSKLQELHVSLNSRLTELLEVSEKAAHAAGKAEAEATERQSKPRG